MSLLSLIFKSFRKIVYIATGGQIICVLDACL